jgi:hypothetical protein
MGDSSFPGDVKVGVHVRQGDYRTHLGGRFYFDSPIYGRLIEKMLDRLSPSRGKFFVFSDEPQNPEDFPSCDIVFQRNAPVVDMYSLARCDLIIGPPSSFSWWASFVGQVPMYMVDSAEDDLMLEGFQVVPRSRDPRLGGLYW